MPKPTSPWTTRQALDSYVYVLPAGYATQTDDNSVVFHAKVGDAFRSVRADEVRSFLEEYRDRTLIAYDALAFHTGCLQAVGGDFQTLWNFSRAYRLWDLALIERRIRYAHAGYADPIQGRKGLETIFRERSEFQSVPTEVQDILTALGPILRKQINWALKNLPVFHTYRADGNIPKPVTIDEYCDNFDAIRVNLHASTPDIIEKNKNFVPAALLLSSFFRRRDIILTGKTGPLGVGIDVRADIASYRINNLCSKRVRPVLTQQSRSYFEAVFRESHGRLCHGSIRECFRWSKEGDGRNRVAYTEDGNLDIVTERMQRRLYAIWKNRLSFITAPHTYPQMSGGEISVCPADWLNYRFFGSPVTDWLELESAASVLHSYTKGTLFHHDAFPALRSLVPEMLLEHEGEPILQAATGRTFIVLRWNNMQESSLVSCLFVNYLLHRRYRNDEEFAYSGDPIFSPLVSSPVENRTKAKNSVSDSGFDCFIQLLLGLQQESGNEESVKIQWTIDNLNGLSGNTLRTLISETLDSFRLLENVDAYRRRLMRLDMSQYRRVADYVYWTIVAGSFRPFSTAFPLPFFKIPGHGVPLEEKDRFLEMIHLFDNDTSPEENPRCDFKKDSILFCSANANELMLTSAVRHFNSKAVGSAEDGGIFFRIADDTDRAWGYINNLHETSYEFFYTQNDIYTEIRRNVKQRGRNKIANELPWTNTVSSTGRLGPPIRYYEWIDADARQLAADLKTAAAFELTAKGFDVVLVAGNQIVLHVPDQQTDLAVQVATSTVQDAITAILNSAFPAENPPVDVFDYFVRNKVNSTVTSVWPISAEPEADDRQDDDTPSEP